MRTSLILLLGMLVSTTTWAASVTQVKNNKLMLELEGESAAPGTEFFVLSGGKRIGLVVVRQVKGNKAVGDITKGRANPGDKAQLRSEWQAANGGGAAASGGRPGRKRGSPVGILAGYAMNSMALTVQSSTNTALKENVTLSGSGFNLKGFYDYTLSPSIVVRASTGLEMFSVTGTTTGATAICDKGLSKTCEVAFNYLAFEGSAHYNYLNGKHKAWIGLGYSFLLAVSKKNTIPNLSSDSSTNQMILFGTGADIGLSGGSFIPVVVEYGMFPGSSNVTASSILARVGYGWHW